MAAPTPYTPAYDFTDYQTANPTDPLPADKLDVELAAVEITTDEIIANLGLIQRDDGALANLSVGNDQLKAEVTIGLNVAAEWLTATAYATNDAVWSSNALYRCAVAHTSGVFATDLAAVKWLLVVSFASQIAAADASEAAAGVSETNAAASEAAAGVSETNAAASAAAAEVAKIEWQGAWLTATEYALHDAVSEAGSSYVCAEAHTSGTFATDLAAVKWELMAQKGSGDLLAANNLSDVADAETARTNLGLGTAAVAGMGVTAGDAVQVDQAVTATTRAATTTLGTSLNHTLSDTDADITAFNGVAGVTYHCRALGTGLITHHATDLIVLQTGASIETAADDTFDVYMLTATTCIVLNYQRASGEALVGSGDAFATQLLHVQDQKTSGTDGGTFTSGSRQTRVINTVLTNGIPGASLGSNQITLPAGTFFIIASAPAYIVNRHKTSLFNVTDAGYTLYGTSEYVGSSYGSVSRSFTTGTFTIADSKVFEFSHECETTRATNGLGVAVNLGETEVYADVMIWKVA